MPSGDRTRRQDVERLLTFGLTARSQLASEKDLWPVIVICAFEHRSHTRQLTRIEPIDAPTGKDAGQGLDVVLAIAAIGPKRVELHDFAREILVQTVPSASDQRGILCIIKVNQHCRMFGDRKQQITKPP